MREAVGMSAFTTKERKSFFFRKHIKEKAFEYLLRLAGSVLLTEAVVYLCGGRNFGLAAVLAAGYTLGGAVYDLYYYKKEWLDVDTKPESGGKRSR